MEKIYENSEFEKESYTLYIALLFGVLNLFSIKVAHLGACISIIEYGIVIYTLTKGKTLTAFLYFLVFLTLSFEFDAFLYVGDPPFIRYSFLKVPFIGPFALIISIILIYLQAKHKYGGIKQSSDSRYFMRWLIILLVAGILQGFIGIVLNDNGINNSPSYPTIYIVETMNYCSLMAFLGAGFLLSGGEHNRNVIIRCSKILLLSLCVVALLSVLLGYEAYASEKEFGNLLAPLSSLFIPFSITFMGYKGGAKERVYNSALFGMSILTIMVSFAFPNVMGSKWYLVIGGSLFIWLTVIIHIKSIKSYFLLLLGAFFIINLLAEPLTVLFSNSDYNEWKATQVFDAIDIFRYNSIEEWFFSLAPSPAFRIDELLNIGIEYIEKPFYVLFGKGFGGTTLHHTHFLNWEQGGGTFSDVQIKLGAYHAMHESLTNIFLRHGILGLVFFIDTIIMLIKKLPYSNWALLGIIWFFFFWRYGITFWIGALAIPLSMNILSNDNSHLILFKRRGKSRLMF